MLGVIAMDQMVVDLGPETESRPGEDVIVFGAGDRVRDVGYGVPWFEAET